MDDARSKLRAWREFRGLTQAQLADRVGTTTAVISHLETGKRGLSAKWLYLLAPALGIQPGFMLDNMPPEALKVGDKLALPAVGNLHDWGSLEQVYERIRWARRSRAGWLRQAHAAKALGVKPGTYRTWEASKVEGGRAPRLPELQLIARTFRVSLRWLLSGEGYPDADVADTFNSLTSGIAEQLTRLNPEQRVWALRAFKGIVDAFENDKSP
ncbi:MAG: XRE family transcriptional regulator [Methylocystaceae bacterium]|nr:XRE family transcriptional regulator [Methylocystaceae bacterium]